MDEVPPYATTEISLPGPPNYARESEAIYSYSLESKGHKWLTLFVTRSGRSPVLVFREGQMISGRVEIDLKKPKILKDITVELQAGITVLGEDEISFLEVKKTLWVPPKAKTKLSGKHSWPFDMLLPKEVSVTGRGNVAKTYRLPPNFSEKGGVAYIDYRLVVTVRRGTFKVNRLLSTNFAYIPNIVPAPPSELRRLAYDQELPIFSPEGDPEGWKVLPKIVVEGILFDVQQVKVECTLAIAKPLCYAAGSPLPLYLTLKSENIQALDTLCSPGAVQLHLLRSLGWGSNATQIAPKSRGKKIVISPVSRATFWPREQGEQQQHERKLEGEIELSSALKPSFVFPGLTMIYHLNLLPFTATGFRSTNPDSDEAVLMSEEVEIATQQTPGIIPHSNIPPAYKLAERTDYAKATGYLLRFSYPSIDH